MPVITGEAIRMMNYVDDISTTLRRIVVNIPMMNDDERKRLSEYMNNVDPNMNSVLGLLAQTSGLPPTPAKEAKEKGK